MDDTDAAAGRCAVAHAETKWPADPPHLMASTTSEAPVDANPWDERNPYQAELERIGRSAKVLRTLGVTFIVAGVLVALLASWYLWGTGWLTARSQTRLEAVFQERLLRVSDEPALPLDEEARDAAAAITEPVAWDDPVVSRGVTPQLSLEGLSDIVPEEAPGAGDPVGRIVIDEIAVDWILVEGVANEQLANGPGHMTGTPLPGQPGNAVVSGHRTTNGAPFYDLDALEPGDLITIETLIGTHTYQVVDSRVVAPSEVWVTDQREGGWLTLTTCHPRYSSRQRLVVMAQLVEGPNATLIHGRYGDPITLPGV